MTRRPAVLRRGPTTGPGQVINEQSELRTVLGRFATGVTVLTAGGAGAHGMTATAFSSVSLTPPMVLCCVARAARMHSAILAADAFAVSILAADQGELARYFADWRRPDGMAQFGRVDTRVGTRTGSPLLNGALGWIECSLDRVHAGGDHSIFVGTVLGCGHGPGTHPLSYFAGDYHQLDPTGRATARTEEAS